MPPDVAVHFAGLPLWLRNELPTLPAALQRRLVAEATTFTRMRIVDARPRLARLTTALGVWGSQFLTYLMEASDLWADLARALGAPPASGRGDADGRRAALPAPPAKPVAAAQPAAGHGPALPDDRILDPYAIPTDPYGPGALIVRPPDIGVLADRWQRGQQALVDWATRQRNLTTANDLAELRTTTRRTARLADRVTLLQAHPVSALPAAGRDAIDDALSPEVRDRAVERTNAADELGALLKAKRNANFIRDNKNVGGPDSELFASARENRQWPPALAAAKRIIAAGEASLAATQAALESLRPKIAAVEGSPNPNHVPPALKEDLAAVESALKQWALAEAARLAAALTARVDASLDADTRIAVVRAEAARLTEPMQRGNLEKFLAAHDAPSLGWQAAVLGGASTDGSLAYLEERVGRYRQNQTRAEAEANAPNAKLALAKEISKDVSAQFKKWNGTLATRGAWWGSDGPGQTKNAKKIPDDIVKLLSRLLAEKGFRFEPSLSGGVSWHKDRGGVDFIYHSLPPPRR